MERKSKAKWFFIGLAAGWAPILAAVGFFLVQANRAGRDDPFGGVRPDMGERVSSLLHPSTGRRTVMPLGDTAFIAAVGPSYYQDERDKDWDYYTISVEKRDGDSSYVFFQRQFKMDDVPSDIVSKEASDIASFDRESQIVTFVVGKTTHTYRLPNR